MALLWLFVVELFVTLFVLFSFILTLHPTRLPLQTGKVIKPRLLGTTNMQKNVVASVLVLSNFFIRFSYAIAIVEYSSCPLRFVPISLV
jgi:hypothetical protein